MDKVLMTRPGYEKLYEELQHLKGPRRRQVIQAIAEAREFGDLSENAEYHAAREEQAHVETRIIEIESKLATANVIELTEKSVDCVVFGSIVRVVDEDTEQEFTYQIVADFEVSLKAGRISNKSPIGQALMGKETGDLVEFMTPGGGRSLEILDVRFGGYLQ